MLIQNFVEPQEFAKERNYCISLLISYTPACQDLNFKRKAKKTFAQAGHLPLLKPGQLQIYQMEVFLDFQAFKMPCPALSQYCNSATPA